MEYTHTYTVFVDGCKRIVIVVVVLLRQGTCSL